MYIKPLIIRFDPEEIAEDKHLIRFKRGPEGIIWELKASKLFVYKCSDLIQVFGGWYLKGSHEYVQGVLNIKLSADNMKRARSRSMTASDILSLDWEDWFIYKIHPSEGHHDEKEHPFNYQKTGSS